MSLSYGWAVARPDPPLRLSTHRLQAFGYVLAEVCSAVTLVPDYTKAMLNLPRRLAGAWQAVTAAAVTRARYEHALVWAVYHVSDGDLASATEALASPQAAPGRSAGRRARARGRAASARPATEGGASTWSSASHHKRRRLSHDAAVAATAASASACDEVIARGAPARPLTESIAAATHGPSLPPLHAAHRSPSRHHRRRRGQARLADTTTTNTTTAAAAAAALIHRRLCAQGTLRRLWLDAQEAEDAVGQHVEHLRSITVAALLSHYLHVAVEASYHDAALSRWLPPVVPLVCREDDDSGTQARRGTRRRRSSAERDTAPVMRRGSLRRVQERQAASHVTFDLLLLCRVLQRARITATPGDDVCRRRGSSGGHDSPDNERASAASPPLLRPASSTRAAASRADRRPDLADELSDDDTDSDEDDGVAAESVVVMPLPLKAFMEACVSLDPTRCAFLLLSRCVVLAHHLRCDDDDAQTLDGAVVSPSPGPAAAAAAATGVFDASDASALYGYLGRGESVDDDAGLYSIVIARRAVGACEHTALCFGSHTFIFVRRHDTAAAAAAALLLRRGAVEDAESGDVEDEEVAASAEAECGAMLQQQQHHNQQQQLSSQAAQLSSAAVSGGLQRRTWPRRLPPLCSAERQVRTDASPRSSSPAVAAPPEGCDTDHHRGVSHDPRRAATPGRVVSGGVIRALTAHDAHRLTRNASIDRGGCGPSSCVAADAGGAGSPPRLTTHNSVHAPTQTAAHAIAVAPVREGAHDWRHASPSAHRPPAQPPPQGTASALCNDAVLERLLRPAWTSTSHSTTTTTTTTASPSDGSGEGDAVSAHFSGEDEQRRWGRRGPSARDAGRSRGGASESDAEVEDEAADDMAPRRGGGQHYVILHAHVCSCCVEECATAAAVADADAAADAAADATRTPPPPCAKHAEHHASASAELHHHDSGGGAPSACLWPDRRRRGHRRSSSSDGVEDTAAPAAAVAEQTRSASDSASTSSFAATPPPRRPPRAADPSARPLPVADPSEGDMAFAAELYARLQCWSLRGQDRSAYIDASWSRQARHTRAVAEAAQHPLSTATPGTAAAAAPAGSAAAATPLCSTHDSDAAPAEQRRPFARLPLSLLHCAVGTIELGDAAVLSPSRGPGAVGVCSDVDSTASNAEEEEEHQATHGASVAAAGSSKSSTPATASPAEATVNAHGRRLLFEALRAATEVVVCGVRESRAHTGHHDVLHQRFSPSPLPPQAVPQPGSPTSSTWLAAVTPWAAVQRRGFPVPVGTLSRDGRNPYAFDAHRHLSAFAIVHWRQGDTAAEEAEEERVEVVARAAAATTSEAEEELTSFTGDRAPPVPRCTSATRRRERECGRRAHTSDEAASRLPRLPASDQHQWRCELLKNEFRIARSRRLDCLLMDRVHGRPIAAITLAPRTWPPTSVEPTAGGAVDVPSAQDVVQRTMYTVVSFTHYVAPLWRHLREEKAVLVDMDRTLVDNAVTVRTAAERHRHLQHVRRATAAADGVAGAADPCLLWQPRTPEPPPTRLYDRPLVRGRNDAAALAEDEVADALCGEAAEVEAEVVYDGAGHRRGYTAVTAAAAAAVRAGVESSSSEHRHAGGNLLRQFFQRTVSQRAHLGTAHYEECGVVHYRAGPPTTSATTKSATAAHSGAERRCDRHATADRDGPPLAERCLSDVVYVRPGARQLLYRVASQWGVPVVMVTKSTRSRAEAIVSHVLDPHGILFPRGRACIVTADEMLDWDCDDDDGDDGRRGATAPVPRHAAERIARCRKDARRVVHMALDATAMEAAGCAWRAPAWCDVQHRLPKPRSVAIIDDAPQVWEAADWRCTVSVAPYTLARLDPRSYFSPRGCVSALVLSCLFGSKCLVCAAGVLHTSAPHGTPSERRPASLSARHPSDALVADRWPHCVCVCPPDHRRDIARAEAAVYSAHSGGWDRGAVEVSTSVSAMLTAVLWYLQHPFAKGPVRGPLLLPAAAGRRPQRSGGAPSPATLVPVDMDAAPAVARGAVHGGGDEWRRGGHRGAAVSLPPLARCTAEVASSSASSSSASSSSATAAASRPCASASGSAVVVNDTAAHGSGESDSLSPSTTHTTTAASLPPTPTTFRGFRDAPPRGDVDDGEEALHSASASLAEPATRPATAGDSPALMHGAGVLVAATAATAPRSSSSDVEDVVPLEALQRGAPETLSTVALRTPHALESAREETATTAGPYAGASTPLAVTTSRGRGSSAIHIEDVVPLPAAQPPGAMPAVFEVELQRPRRSRVDDAGGTVEDVVPLRLEPSGG
ncbi:hypothetical protein NESM_000346200 [Novymonas esmeraldas]|uniref:Uncharacterized protein n=1 Tax=Novymonas esmeraldas TaxID=1808958 RepID=A0AAW0EJP4_9TRYP